MILVSTIMHSRIFLKNQFKESHYLDSGAKVLAYSTNIVEVEVWDGLTSPSL